MIYAVDRNTGKHRVHTPGYPSSREEYFIEADADEWIEWVATEDSESPINEDTPYEAMLRDNRISAGVYRWDNIPPRESQVIAYRPILSGKEKDMKNGAACNGINCSAKAPDYNHSVECRFEHFMAYSGNGNTEECKAILDLSCKLRDLVNEYPAASVKTPQWNGDGLPPVGCECEFEHAEEGNWVNAKVIGYDGPACVVALDGFGYSGSDNPRDFRPIRTDRERWTDAAMEAAECYDSAPLIRQYFEAIYDTGLARLPEDV